MTIEQICAKVEECLARKRRDYVLAIFGEDLDMFDAAEAVRKKLSVSVKCNMIGYQQRGGVPTASERQHAAGFALCALEAVEKGLADKYVVYAEGRYCCLDLACAEQKKVFAITEAPARISII
jgi:6-phosphofructokinase 1